MAINTDEQKRVAAEGAVCEVRHGMIVGLGTGTTAAFAITALGQRIADGLAVEAVATSEATERAAVANGIRIRDLAEIPSIDLCIDGVDEIDPDFRAIKGAGGAMLREKIVASAAARMIAIADGSKVVSRLGAHPVPVEVLPSARAFVAARIGTLGAEAVLRRGVDGSPIGTDQHNIILDCKFGPAHNLDTIAAALDKIPGVLGHGLFLGEIDVLYLGTANGLIRRERMKNS